MSKKPTTKPKPRAHWHAYHRDSLVQFIPSGRARRKQIRETKLADEIETRLRLMKPVKGKLPAEVCRAGAARDKAWAAYDKAWAAHDKAWAAHDKAGAAYDKARAAYYKARAARDKAWAAHDKAHQDHLPAIEALHAKECKNCPWDGRTIFPKKK